MKPVKIFVEGEDDKKFINDYLIFLSPNYPEASNDIDYTSGWTKLHESDNKFKENTDAGGVNLIIFDADEKPLKRREEILQKKEELGIEFELFLLPNDESPGELETLLENIINPQHKRIFDFFDSYERCLGENRVYTLPNRKARIYAYLEALSGKTKSGKKQIEEKKRDYSNPNHWNLDDGYLSPLKNFLLPFLNARDSDFK